MADGVSGGHVDSGPTHPNHAPNHLWHDEHVPQVSLDDGGFLIGRGLLLRLAELLDETHGLALQATAEPTAGAGVDELAKAASD